MNRFWGIGIALLGVLMVAASPAGAGCPSDGTIPGEGPSVTTVSTPAGTFYIDDRDYLDVDEDGQADGIWIYQEANGDEGLQRGGRHAAFEEWDERGLPSVALPSIGPVQVGPFTLFPCANARCQSSLRTLPDDLESWGFRDDCVEAASPDRLLF